MKPSGEIKNQILREIKQNQQRHENYAQNNLVKKYKIETEEIRMINDTNKKSRMSGIAEKLGRFASRAVAAAITLVFVGAAAFGIYYLQTSGQPAGNAGSLGSNSDIPKALQNQEEHIYNQTYIEPSSFKQGLNWFHIKWTNSQCECGDVISSLGDGYIVYCKDNIEGCPGTCGALEFDNDDMMLESPTDGQEIPDFDDIDDGIIDEGDLPPMQPPYKSFLGLATVAQYWSLDDLYYDIVLDRAGVPKPSDIETVRLAEITDIYFPEVYLNGQGTITCIQVCTDEETIGLWANIDSNFNDSGYHNRSGNHAKWHWESALSYTDRSIYPDDSTYPKGVLHVEFYDADCSIILWKTERYYQFLWWQDDVLMVFYCNPTLYFEIIEQEDGITPYLTAVKTSIEPFLPEIDLPE